MSRVEARARAATADVVVTDDGVAQGRSALAAVRALAAAGHRPAVARSGRWSLAAASRWCVAAVDVAPPDDGAYAAAIGRAASDLGASAVLASSDAALLALGAPVTHLLDKIRLLAAAEAAGIPTPETRVFRTAAELIAAARSLRYPVVVKLPISRVPARRVNDAEEMRAATWGEGPFLVQRFVEAGLRAVGGVAWRGRLVAAVHQRYLRTWPVDCGTASAAVTVEPDAAVEERLTRLLAGYDGIFQAQFAGEHLLDLNPRVYGSMPLAVAAGANLPALALALASGEEVGSVRGRPGVGYRWIEGDLRAAIRLVRSGRLSVGAAARALRPRRGNVHSVVSVRDPGPLATRLRYVARGAR